MMISRWGVGQVAGVDYIYDECGLTPGGYLHEFVLSDLLI